MLRNPSDKAQAITLRLAVAYELPQDAARTYRVRSPWKEDAEKAAERMNADEPHRYTLAPFEVRTLEMTPVEGAKR